MEPAEHKQLEGQRIQQVLGAIGALPAAMLVFGEGPSTAASGAPLFASAIALVVGALMSWNYTDDAYHMDSLVHVVPPEHQAELKAWQSDVERSGHIFQSWTYAYGILSIFCSLAGVAGVYSTIRTNVSVNAGFVLVALCAVGVSVEVVLSGMRRNRLVSESRRLSCLGQSSAR